MKTGWRRAAADARLLILHILSLPARFDPLPGPGPEDGKALSDDELGQLRELRDSWDAEPPKCRGIRDEWLGWNVIKDICGPSATDYDPLKPGASYSDLFNLYDGLPDDQEDS